MAQLMALDYGKARCGLAVTDDAQIIASALTTVLTPQLAEFLKRYFAQHQVEKLIIGQPTDLKGNLNEVEEDIQKFIQEFKTNHPFIVVVRHDERFTSKMASRVIFQSGKSKKKRQEKGLVDQVSATLLLQEYMNL